MGLITNEVEITLNNRTIRWYENKGYEIPKYYNKKRCKYIIKSGTKIKVKVEDLTNGSTPIIDTNVNINIPRSAIAFDETKHKYKCSCCGKGFTKQQGNFQKTNDVLYQANGGYLPWCKECTDRYVEQISTIQMLKESQLMLILLLLLEN